MAVPEVGVNLKNTTPPTVLVVTVVSSYTSLQGGKAEGLGERVRAEDPEVSDRENRAMDTVEICLKGRASTVMV